MSKKKLGILISGGGTNLQAIINACKEGILKDIAEIAVVISNRPDAYGLVRAQNNSIPAVCINSREIKDRVRLSEEITKELNNRNVELVCLAGFLLKLEANLIEAFKGRIINIHPALLPKFGGKGMYGHHVHEAVITACEKESGATVHWVDEEFDHGAAIAQESVAIIPGDTPDTLAMKVLEIEHRIYPEAIKKIIENNIVH